MKCPYTGIWCDKRESEDDRYYCDSCIVIFPDMYGGKDD